MGPRAATARIALVFVATRALLLVAAVVPWPLERCLRYEVSQGGGAPPLLVEVPWRSASDGRPRYLPGDPPALLDAFARMDAEYYLAIAAFGYVRNEDGSLPQRAGFFPGYPAAIRGATHVWNAVRGRPGAPLLEDKAALLCAAFFVSNGALLVAALLLYRLGRRVLDADRAEAAAHWISCCPFSFFGSAYLAESAFLALSIAAIDLALRRRMLLAAIVAAAAAFTRPVGVLLLAPLLWISWRGRAERRRAAADLATFALLVPGGAVLVLLLQDATLGDPFAYFAIQRGYGHGGFPDLSGIADLFRTTGKNAVELVRDGVQAAALLGAVAALVALVRARAPVALVAFGALLVGVPLLSGHVISLPRYVFGAFPLFLGAAALTPRSRGGWAALAGGVVLQIAGFAVFTRAWPILV